MSTYTDYASLKTDVESWAARSDFPETVYKLATTFINRKLRVREMISGFSSTTSTETDALPSDFLEFNLLYIDRDPRVVLSAADGFSQTLGYRASGTPTSYWIDNGYLYLNPAPDGSYDLVGRYYARLDDFSADADTNTILTTYPDIYLSASLSYVYLWDRDDTEAARWTAVAQGLIEDANAADVKTRFAGPVKMRPRAYA